MRIALGLGCILLSLALAVDARAAGVSWSDLEMGLYPVAVMPSSDLLGMRIATAPGGPLGLAAIDENRLAYCGPDAIWRTLDGGLSWSPISVGPVAAAAASGPLPLTPHLDGTPACHSVTLDPADPDTFYAVFRAIRPPQSAPPPWFAAGFYTRDAGQSWQPVPLPDGADASQFGGFEAHANGVQALWQPAATPPGDGQVAPPQLMVTNDGGGTWQPAAFGCPATGPCIRWGAPPTGIGACAMHGLPQPLLVSADGGQSWRAPEGASTVNACSPNQLAVLSDTDIVLLAPGSSEVDPRAAPVRLSRDGGRTFVPVALPPGLPDPGPRELALPPDGRLLALTGGTDPVWHIADPGSVYWCDAMSSVLPPTVTPLSVSADRLWWLAASAQPTSTSFADLACAGPETVPSSVPVSGPQPTLTPR